MARCGIGHGKEPPPFFRGQALPVLNGSGDETRVGVFDGPGEQHQFLAQQAGERGASLCASPPGRKSCLPKTLVENHLGFSRDAFPLPQRQDDPDFLVLPSESKAQFPPCCGIIPRKMLRNKNLICGVGDQKMVVAAGWRETKTQRILSRQGVGIRHHSSLFGRTAVERFFGGRFTRHRQGWLTVPLLLL